MPSSLCRALSLLSLVAGCRYGEGRWAALQSERTALHEARKQSEIVLAAAETRRREAEKALVLAQQVPLSLLLCVWPLSLCLSVPLCLSACTIRRYCGQRSKRRRPPSSRRCRAQRVCSVGRSHGPRQEGQTRNRRVEKRRSSGTWVMPTTKVSLRPCACPCPCLCLKV